MLLIYSSKVTPRIRYVLDWICDQWGIKYTVTGELTQFAASEIPKVSYTGERIAGPDVLWIKSSSNLLNEKGVTNRRTDVIWSDGTPYIFPDDGDLGFDVFGAIFFMLSRYEEYLPFKADQHGRFPATASLAYQKGFLEWPVVDMWLHTLKKNLKNRFPGLILKPTPFASRLTFDIDVTFKFKGRSFSNNLMALGKDLLTLKWKNVSDRISVLRGSKHDPWDVYKKVTGWINEYNINVLFFFLCVSGSRFDRNLSFGHKATTALLNWLKTVAEPALHPSYYSSGDGRQVQKEKRMLEEMLGQHVISSRQHFLRLEFPHTFRVLQGCGIRNEYSMMYPDAPGFRAGTARPFYFYDLQEEKESELKFFPGCWMDSTFVHYRREDAGTAFNKAVELMNRIQRYGGIFIPVFHNNYLAEASWIQVQHKIMKEISKRIHQ